MSVGAPRRRRPRGDDSACRAERRQRRRGRARTTPASAPAWSLLSSALIVLIAAALGWMLLGGGSDTVTVPNVDGKSQSAATAKLEAAGLKVKVRKVNVANAKAGEVVGQTPRQAPRSTRPASSRCRSPPGNVRIPVDDLVGSTYDEAVAALDKLGLKAVAHVRAVRQGRRHRDRRRPEHHGEDRLDRDADRGQRRRGHPDTDGRQGQGQARTTRRTRSRGRASGNGNGAATTEEPSPTTHRRRPTPHAAPGEPLSARRECPPPAVPLNTAYGVFL